MLIFKKEMRDFSVAETEALSLKHAGRLPVKTEMVIMHEGLFGVERLVHYGNSASIEPSFRGQWVHHRGSYLGEPGSYLGEP